MGKPPSDRDYEVGYGKPPKASQFKKGRSGNPSGAPKKARARKSGDNTFSLDRSILQAMERLLTINENGKRTKISTSDAIIRSMLVDAAKDGRSSQKLIGIAQAALDRLQTANTEQFGLLVRYVYSERACRSRPAATALDRQAWPHPDDVELDFSNCTGRALGPIDALQARPFFALVADCRLWQARLDQLSRMALQVSIDEQGFYGLVVGQISDLISAIRAQLPPSFSAQLDWDEGEVPAGALDVEGLTEGEIVNLALLPPAGDEISYGLYQLAESAKAASAAIRDRGKLDVGINTTSLINRLQIEGQINGGGAPPASAAPDFAEYYARFASAEQRNVDAEVAP